MPLSEYEQRVLEQMERQLHADDPKLASSLENPGPRKVARPWRYVIAVLACAAGLGLLLFGVASGAAWLGVIGFVVIFAGAMVALTKPGKRGPQGVVDPSTSKVKKRRTQTSGSSTTRQSKSFMQSLEDRWDKRRRERGL